VVGSSEAVGVGVVLAGERSLLQARSGKQCVLGSWTASWLSNV
jgi:hypothetical protein